MVTRVTGMASGMDIEGTVKKLMQAERQPLDKMNANKQLMEWKRESYREVSTKIVTFAQSKINDVFSKATALDAQKVTVSGDTSAVTAKAGASASGILDIKVTSLAKSASLQSSSAPTLKDTSAAAPTDWSSVKLADINNTSLTGTNTEIKIGGVAVSIDNATETLGSLVDKINSKSGMPVTAVMDSATGKISLTSKTTGKAGNDTTLTDAGGVLSSLGISGAFKDGADASLTINGLAVSRASNSFTMNGIDLTLNSVSSTATHIEATRDTDKVVENVQAFITAYNELLSGLNGKTNEERYKKYAPLTTEQRAEMSDSEAELWTNKAKSGMLKNDSIINSMAGSMRTAMMEKVKLDSNINVKQSDGTTKSVNEIDMSYLGITTGSWETKGQLTLNVDKLKAALEENPDIVNNFFGKNYNTAFSSNTYTASDGIFARMKKISSGTLDSLAKTAGTSIVSTDLNASFKADSVMGGNLKDLNTKISDFQSRLTRKENSYYAKFSAMETAMSKYNTLSSSLSSYL